MKCRQARDLIGAYLYGDLAPEEMRALRVHAQDCTLCREDLASRGRIVSSLDDNAPTLSEEEKQRIVWSVKGAVRRKQLETRPLALRLLPAFGIATVLVAGIAVGQMVMTRSGRSGAALAKQPPKVQVKEVQPPADKNDKTAEQVTDFLQSFYTGTVEPYRGSNPGSRSPYDHKLLILQEPTYKLKPDSGSTGGVSKQPSAPTENSPKDSAPAVDKTETGTGSEATKLPKVTDPKNAETTPSDSP